MPFSPGAFLFGDSLIASSISECSSFFPSVSASSSLILGMLFRRWVISSCLVSSGVLVSVFGHLCGVWPSLLTFQMSLLCSLGGTILSVSFPLWYLFLFFLFLTGTRIYL